MHTSLSEDLHRLAALARPFQPAGGDVQLLETVRHVKGGRCGFALTEDGIRVAHVLRREFLDLEERIYSRDWTPDEWVPVHTILVLAGALDGALYCQMDDGPSGGDVLTGVAVVLEAMAEQAAPALV